MKKWFITFVFISSFLVLSGCSNDTLEESKEEFTDAFNQKAELSAYLKDNNEAVEQYNQSVELFSNAMEEIDDLGLLTETLDKDIIPAIDAAISLSYNGEYKASIYGELKKKRTDAMMKTKEGFEKFSSLYKRTDFTEEDESDAYAMLEQAFLLLETYETDLVEIGKEMNEKIELK